DSLLGILTALISQRTQPLWIPLSAENRTNDSHASDPGDVRDHLPELYVHLLEGFLHVADMVGGVSHQHGTLAKITPQHADLIVGPECPGQKPKGMELLDPLAVEHIGLSPWHVIVPLLPVSSDNRKAGNLSLLPRATAFGSMTSEQWALKRLPPHPTVSIPRCHAFCNARHAVCSPFLF